MDKDIMEQQDVESFITTLKVIIDLFEKGKLKFIKKPNDDNFYCLYQINIREKIKGRGKTEYSAALDFILEFLKETV